MEEIYDLIIVGGGPAGITAGIYAARGKLSTLLIAKAFGGQMTRKAVEIENYPGFQKISGTDLIQKFVSHLKKQDVEILDDSVNKVEKLAEQFSVSTKGKKTLKTRTVIIASGADPRLLEVPGEKELIGKGVSYCVACDGPLFADKQVAVAGGGNAAFEAALSLSNYAEKIYILEHGSQVKADKENQLRAEKTKKIEVITNVVIKRLEGKGFLEKVVYQQKPSKNLKELQVQGIFIEIGSQPATSFIKDLVEFNEKEEIVINYQTHQTKTPGLFAAGDATCLKYKQIIVAAGQGAQAALAVNDYIQKQK